MQEAVSKSGPVEFPLPTMTDGEIRALKTCTGNLIPEDEIPQVATSIAGVIPIPGGVAFRLRNGEERPGGNLNYAWALGLALLQAVVTTQRERGGWMPAWEMGESLRDFIAKNDL